MGMFDTIRFHGDVAPRCPAGHRLADLQTKDLECTLEVYSVLEGRLYRPAKERSESVAIDDRGRLILTESRLAEPASISASLTAYGFCADCRPVLYLGEGGLHRDSVQERRPWCEWRFVFRDGRLERCEAVRTESREVVAEALRREGLEVLGDDERLARLHFERAAKRGWSDW
jgi:hypothetical protein